MRVILRLILYLILIICFSCEEQGLFVHCPDCTADEPVSAELEAKLDYNTNGTTRVRIYEGNIEDNILFGSFDAYGSTTFYRNVPINKKYTITATYYVTASGKTFIATDSATPRVKYDKYQCDDPCYFVYDRVCDLRVKYTN